MKFLDYSAVAVTIPQTDFDPDFDQPPWVWAAMYRACGLQVVPCKNKRPALHEWKEFQNELIPQSLFDIWYGQDGKYIALDDMGMLTGPASGGKIMLDLDTYKSAAAGNWWQSVLAVHNNGMELETWEQFTGGGGRQMFFQCPPGWMVSNASTDIDVDVRGRGGFAVLPPTMHASKKQYVWRPGRGPWEMEILTAPPWLMDEIERLILEHGGGNISRIEAGERPIFDGFQRTSFGTIADGREKYMVSLIWAALIGHKAEGFPLLPRKTELDVVYLDYSHNVSVKDPLPGESREDGLEREGRGYSAFVEKWNYALKQWDGKIAEAAEVRKARGVNSGQLNPQPKIDPKTGEVLPLILTAEQFLSGYVPPSYLIDGMVQRGYLYSLTARTGHGKTAVAMPMGAAVARGITFHGKPCQQGSVLFLAGENSQDIRARYRALAHHEGFDAEAIPFYFVDGVIDLAASMVRIREEAAKIGELALIVVDTAQAYFRGDDVNNNAQQGQFAQLLRVLTRLPGSPTVIVNCHPVKNAARDNLVPMGGSHFINEVDANLTLWADERVCTLEPHSAKWRGAPFESIQFDLTTILCDAVKDAKGRHMPSVVAVPITEAGAERKAVVAESEEDTVLRLMHTYKNASQAYLAKMALFTWPDGTPYKTKVARIQARLLASKMVYRYRGSTKYRLTKKGCKVIGVKFEVETDDD